MSTAATATATMTTTTTTERKDDDFFDAHLIECLGCGGVYRTLAPARYVRDGRDDDDKGLSETTVREMRDDGTLRGVERVERTRRDPRRTHVSFRDGTGDRWRDARRA